jgi:hypothetical protein
MSMASVESCSSTSEERSQPFAVVSLPNNVNAVGALAAASRSMRQGEALHESADVVSQPIGNGFMGSPQSIISFDISVASLDYSENDNDYSPTTLGTIRYQGNEPGVRPRLQARPSTGRSIFSPFYETTDHVPSSTFEHDGFSSGQENHISLHRDNGRLFVTSSTCPSHILLPEM